MGTDPAVRPASTVILLRDSPDGPQTYMLRRHHSAAFMAGAHVFPGGAVDPADSGATADWCDGVDAAAAQDGGIEPRDGSAHAVAAVRELFEEAGVLLARNVDGDLVPLAAEQVRARFMRHRADVHARRRTLRDVVEGERLRLALDALVSFAHWVTPAGGSSRRFDTRFFVASVPAGQAPAHDNTEATDGAWMTPGDAIAAATARRIVLPPPTWATLLELQPFMSVVDVLSWARTRNVERRQPDIVEEDGRRLLVLPGDRGADRPGAVPSETRFIWAGDGWRPEGSS